MKYHIVMADVVNSRSYKGTELLPVFQGLVATCNERFHRDLLSPYTITLGDEFQGVVASLKAAVDTIFFLDETLLDLEPSFRLRYVIVLGEIDTPVNPFIAHGMAGPGLTLARELLAKKRRGRPRFQISIQGMGAEVQMTMLFRLVELLSAHWHRKDYRLINELLHVDNDEEVASKFHKNRSQIWKRRKSLQIEEYMIVKTLIYQAIAGIEGDNG